MKRKKGDVTDIFTFLIVLFFLAVSFVAVGYVMTKLKLVVQTTPLNSTSVGQTVITDYDVITFSTIPNSFIFMFAILIIGQIASSFLVRYHPIFIFLYIIFAGIAVFLSFVIGNTYQLFMNAQELNGVAIQMTSLTWVMQHIAIIICAVAALNLIILFARLPGTEGGNPI